MMFSLLELFQSRSKKIENKLHSYRRGILSGIESIDSSTSIIKMYIDHFETLDKIEIAYRNNDKKLLEEIFENETRYFGWSFLPGKIGDLVERDFYYLKKIILR